MCWLGLLRMNIFRWKSWVWNFKFTLSFVFCNDKKRISSITFSQLQINVEQDVDSDISVSDDVDSNDSSNFVSDDDDDVGYHHNSINVSLKILLSTKFEV